MQIIAMSGLHHGEKYVLKTKVDFAAPLSDALFSLQNTNYSVFLL